MPRIVSLIASATEIVHALGMGEYQVGRSHECDFPPSVQSLPVCTAPKFPVSGSSQELDEKVKDTLHQAVSVYDVFDDVLERLEPTHIITQSQCEVCAVSLRDVERAVSARLSSKPKIVSLQPNSLVDVWNDIQQVSEALGITGQGNVLTETLKLRMQSISEQALLDKERPRVACIEWLEPPMAAGNWVPELVEMAGGVNLFGDARRHSPWMMWDQVIEHDPDVIVVMPCGFDMKRTMQEMYWFADRPQWPTLKAVHNHRVYVTDGNQFFNRPGPRLVESLQILAELLHPFAFEPKLMGTGWQQFHSISNDSKASQAVNFRPGKT